MKIINILVYLNRFFIGSTIILYVTIFLGLLAQIALGGLQVLSAIFLIFIFKKLKVQRKKELIIYWCFVIFYALLWNVEITNPTNDWYETLFYVLIPLSLAIYFSYIIESIRKEL